MTAAPPPPPDLRPPNFTVGLSPMADGSLMLTIYRASDGQQACVLLTDDDFGGPSSPAQPARLARP